MAQRSKSAGRKDDPALTARLVAFDVITDVLHKRLPLDGSFDSMAQRRKLAGKDRAYAEFIVRTVLKRRGQIEPLHDQPIAAQSHAGDGCASGWYRAVAVFGDGPTCRRIDDR